jgi:hypothetical protein
MADYYFIYSVIDIIWKIFSILFVLYKFTSFFSMLYEFFKFLGKLLKGLIYVKDQIVIYIRKRQNVNYNFDNPDLPIRPKSFYTIFREHCLKLYNKIFGNSNHNTYLPLYETRTEYTNNFEESEHEVFNFKNRHSIQTDEFNNLLNSNISIQSNNRVSSNLDTSNDIFNSYQTYQTTPYNSNYDINTSSSSIYPPPQKKKEKKTIKEPLNVQNNFNLLKSKFINNIIGNINEKNKENENVFDESVLNEDDEESDFLFTSNI